MSQAASSTAASKQQRWLLVLLLVTSVALAWRMFSIISEHAVNLLTWDLWDIYPPALFEERSWWDLVRYQVGQTRQGPGFLVTRFVADLTSMNTRAESFAIGVAFCLTLAATLWLERRTAGRFYLSDTILPVIVLTAVQQDTWVGVPNLSVGGASLFLMVLLGLSWTLEGPAMRVTAVVVFNALLVNSGYGLLAAPLAPAIFSVELFHAAQRGERKRAVWAGAGLAGSLAAAVLFLHGWIGTHSACTASVGLDQLMLPGFMVLMFAKFIGLDFDHVGLFATLAGTVLFFVMLGVLAHHAKQLISRPDGSALSRIITTLIGFSLIYSFMSGYGRICESLLVSQASRHMTFMIPAFVGLYLDLRTRGEFRWRRPALASLFAAALLGAFSLELVTDDGAARNSENKRRWKECYLRTEDVARCDAEAGVQVYPAGAETHLPPRLEYLKANRLNLYAAEPGRFRFLDEPASGD